MTTIVLTEGSIAAMHRIQDGAYVMREINRASYRWSDNPDELLHHLTFKNMLENGMVYQHSRRRRSGYDTFGLTDEGRDYLAELDG